ncbi:MAG: flagellar brake protein [Spirochaetaceae bacterium]
MLGLLSLLAVWVGVLMYYHLRDLRRQRQERRRQAEAAWNEHLRRLDLPPSWAEVARTLAGYLRDPSEKYLLFENRQSFDLAARAALEDGAVAESSISALRVRLGFSAGPQSSPPSTAGLAAGATVFIRGTGSRHPIRARVLGPEPHNLKLQLQEQACSFPTGSTVVLYHRNDRGVFRIVTDVLGCEEKVLWVRHSEHVSREQKRKFFRKRLSAPVRVARDREETAIHRTHLRDLGGGGASFLNPEGRFTVGDLVRMELTARDGTHLWLHAKVLRVSENGRICHVEFYSIRESVRDKIYNMIFLPSQGERGYSSKEL